MLDDQVPQLQRLGGEAELVTVAVGANDIRPRRRAELAPALEVLLSVLPAGAVIATIPGRPKIVRPFNELIRQRAAERRLRVAETADAIRPPWRGKLASDYFHPSDVGYTSWAEAFARSLAGEE